MPKSSHPNALVYIKHFISVTSPHVIEFSDGEVYVVKFKENPWGQRVVVNEYVVSRIASLLGFSHKVGKLVYVSQQFVDDNPFAQGLKEGIQFGAPYFNDFIDFSSENVKELKNVKELGQIPVLDTLFCNDDRHPGNILVVHDGSGRARLARFYLIDHGHAFEGKDWTIETLEELVTSKKLYMDAVDFRVIPRRMASFDSFLLKLESLKSSVIKDVIDSIPDEWELDKYEKQSLEEFINTRKTLVRNIIDEHL
jgi:hypothetical protein